jgi:hypothetical protein
MKQKLRQIWVICMAALAVPLSSLLAANLPAAEKLNTDSHVEALLAQTTLDEKIGQMVQVDSDALKDKADVLFGDSKFTGKLPRTWPRSNAHIVSINKSEKPLFPFAFGLTY